MDLYIAGSVNRWICRSLHRYFDVSIDLLIFRSIDLEIAGSVDRWIGWSMDL